MSETAPERAADIYGLQHGNPEPAQPPLLEELTAEAPGHESPQEIIQRQWLMLDVK